MIRFPRAFVMAAIAITCVGTLTPTAQATIVVVAQYTFNDNATPAGFTNIGTPSYSGGQMVLNGTNAIRDTTTPLTATDNFGIEAILTPTTLDGFNFTVANANGANNGWGLLSIGSNYHAIAEGSGNFGTPGHPITLSTEIRVALVRSGGTATFYINGVASGTTTGVSRATPTILTIGNNQNSLTPTFEGPFKGSINEVRLFTFTAGQFSTSDLLTSATVPEPGTGTMLLFGLVGIWLMRRTRTA